MLDGFSSRVLHSLQRIKASSCTIRRSTPTAGTTRQKHISSRNGVAHQTLLNLPELNKNACAIRRRITARESDASREVHAAAISDFDLNAVGVELSLRGISLECSLC